MLCDDAFDVRLLAESMTITVLSRLKSPVTVAAFESGIAELVSSVNTDFTEWFEKAMQIAIGYEEMHLRELQVGLASSSLYAELSKRATSAMSKEEVKGKGATHTPISLADHITKNAIKWWRRQNPGIENPSIVGDLSVGVGPFLALLEQQGFPKSTKFIGMDVDLNSILNCELMNLAVGGKWQLYWTD